MIVCLSFVSCYCFHICAFHFHHFHLHMCFSHFSSLRSSLLSQVDLLHTFSICAASLCISGLGPCSMTDKVQISKSVHKDLLPCLCQVDLFSKLSFLIKLSATSKIVEAQLVPPNMWPYVVYWIHVLLSRLFPFAIGLKRNTTRTPVSFTLAQEPYSRF